MYTSHFGLTEKPFAITPDPRYLYLSERHAEALAHLSYGIREAGGFIQLTGEVGTGKTTVLRSLLQQLPANCDIALILNPRVTPAEFLLAICDELHVPVPDRTRGSVKELVDLLNRVLLEAHARGRRVVVMVDEAQNLSPDVLEQVRLLTNLETATQKLLQIILIGQPELRDALARTDLRQLAQRITGRYHLEALSRSETAAYVQHRLRVAGSVAEVFTPAALTEIHRLSGGIPRIINVLCDRALLGAYTREERRVGPDLVRSAASEVYGRPVMPPFVRWAAIAGALAGIALLGLAVWQSWPSTPKAVPAAATAAPVPAPAAVTPAQPDEPAPLPSVASLLAAHAAETTTDAAFSRLFRLWQAQYAPGAVRPCDQAVDQGLQCVAQRGTFAQLRLINRPAILSLVDGSGAEHQVVVSALDGDRARIELGDSSRDVSFADLASYWFGEFLIVWRPQVAMAKELRPGMRGDDVRWLRRGLEKVGGLPERGGDDDVFDGELSRLVLDFQRTHRLSVDGIAGMQTQLVLDSALGTPGTPRLTPMAGGGGA